MPFEISIVLLLAAASLAFFAGMVKGITGFAMPMIFISGLGSFLAPEIALAGLILPTLVTNVWQASRTGLIAAFKSVKAHWRFMLIGVICLALSAQVVSAISDSTLYLILGLPVTLFAVLQLAGWRPTISQKNYRKVEFGVGTFAGILGGLSGLWGPPTVLYLTALNIPKTEHVRIQGVIFGCGAIALDVAHLQSGVLSAEGFKFSAMMIPPALLGMAAGFAIQDRLDQDKFRLAILVVLTVAGLNLIRRAMFI